MKKSYICLTVLALAALSTTTAKGQEAAGSSNGLGPNHIGELKAFWGEDYWQHRALKANEVDFSENNVIGSTFLTDSWNSGTIFFTMNRKLVHPQYQFDIEFNQILLKDENKPKESTDAKIIDAVNVIAFVIQDKTATTREFVNSLNAGFKVEGIPLLGFVEVLEAGKLTLLRRIQTTVMPADYNAALNVGSKKDKIVKKEIYYLKKQDSNELVEASQNQKSNLAALGAHQEQIKAYMKENKLKFKPGDDLAKIIAYYNTL